jgi:hypothetical protein
MKRHPEGWTCVRLARAKDPVEATCGRGLSFEVDFPNLKQILRSYVRAINPGNAAQDDGIKWIG